MANLFLRRKFKSSVLVDIKMSRPSDFNLVKKLVLFTLETELFPIKSIELGNGVYLAIHKKEDGRKIQKFVKKWVDSRRTKLRRKS